MFPPIWIEEAQKRIAPHIRLTPLQHDEELGLYIKWENKQLTGSFKLRGAVNKILSLQPWEIERGSSPLGHVEGSPRSIVLLEGVTPKSIPALSRVSVGLADVTWVDSTAAHAELIARYRTTPGPR